MKRFYNNIFNDYMIADKNGRQFTAASATNATHYICGRSKTKNTILFVFAIIKNNWYVPFPKNRCNSIYSSLLLSKSFGQCSKPNHMPYQKWIVFHREKRKKKQSKNKIISLYLIEMPLASYIAKQWKQLKLYFRLALVDVSKSLFSLRVFFFLARWTNFSSGCICMTLENTIRNFGNLLSQIVNTGLLAYRLCVVGGMEVLFYVSRTTNVVLIVCAIFCLSWSMVWVLENS